MSISKQDERGGWDRFGRDYNVPGEPPREEMWDRISERISGDDPEVFDLGAERRRRAARVGGPTELGEHAHRWAPRRIGGWAVAAAAMLILGIGIGRMSAPGPSLVDGPTESPAATGSTGLELAARNHLDRTESLLTMVRADARKGKVDPAVAGWAEDLLAQTRLLLDRPDGVDPELRDLLLDLELVLVQVVGVAGSGDDEARVRTEVELTLRSLDEEELLPRIQAALPQTMAGA
jgi:hypothetical protein